MINQLDRTVRIPVRIVKGEVRYFYGGDLPDLDYAIGELIIPQFAVKDHKFIELAQMETTVELFPPNSILMIAVNADNITETLRDNVHSLRTVIWTNESFVKVRLLESLYLQLRGSKKSVLRDVNCYIPSIKKEAKSLNNAYTLISEEFEPHRRSHAGNIFSKCYYQNDDLWYPLENLRQKHEAEFEEVFFLDYKVFFLNPIPPPERKDNQLSLFDMHDENLVQSMIIEMGQNQCMTGLEIKQFFKEQKNHQLKDWVVTINYLLDEGILLEKKE